MMGGEAQDETIVFCGVYYTRSNWCGVSGVIGAGVSGDIGLE